MECLNVIFAWVKAYVLLQGRIQHIHFTATKTIETINLHAVMAGLGCHLLYCLTFVMRCACIVMVIVSYSSCTAHTV